jgi:hypothetical protein
MSYMSALEAAGATVLAFKEFGTYQGEWYAYVEYQGQRGWVEGSYGSCTQCDAFEAEFGYDYADGDDYDARLKSFGESYLPPAESSVNILSYLDGAEEWDDAPHEAAYWIRSVEALYKAVH